MSTTCLAPRALHVGEQTPDLDRDSLELGDCVAQRARQLGLQGDALRAFVAPLALTVALTALELLVAFLQAYVFAILTCIYLNDAIHPGH